jgi:hypothetical protein
MHRFLFILLLTLLNQFAFAQEDSSIRSRLESFLAFTETMDVDKALDITYPRVFALVSREDMKKELKKSMNSEEVSVRLDSFRVDTIFPVFQLDSGQYAKIFYRMNMHMKILQQAEDEEETDPDMMVRIFEFQFGEGNVSYNKEKKEFKIRHRAALVAIRDDISPQWTFLNLETDSPLSGILFSEKLLEKLETYK